VAQAQWRNYQDEAAEFFASLGCLVSIDTRVQGARAAHNVDVNVVFSKWGMSHLWIVECKQQKRPVTKADVETLKSIVGDIGADRGFLLSEAGFQPSALAAASRTNVSLLSLAQLRASARADLVKHLLSFLESEALSLMKRLKEFIVITERGEHGATCRVKPGVDFMRTHEAIGSLIFLLAALQGSKIGCYEFGMPDRFPTKRKRFDVLPDADTVLSIGSRLVDDIERWYDVQISTVERAALRSKNSGTEENKRSSKR
jgi:hypothetical protein